MALVIKSNIRKVVKDLDKENSVSSVADEVETALERKVEETNRKFDDRVRKLERGSATDE